MIVDYALPENKVGKFLIFHFVKLYEGYLYKEFIESDFKSLLMNLKIEIKEEYSVLLGAARIIKGINIKN